MRRRTALDPTMDRNAIFQEHKRETEETNQKRKMEQKIERKGRKNRRDKTGYSL